MLANDAATINYIGCLHIMPFSELWGLLVLEFDADVAEETAASFMSVEMEACFLRTSVRILGFTTQEQRLPSKSKKFP